MPEYRLFKRSFFIEADLLLYRKMIRHLFSSVCFCYTGCCNNCFPVSLALLSFAGTFHHLFRLFMSLFQSLFFFRQLFFHFCSQAVDPLLQDHPCHHQGARQGTATRFVDPTELQISRLFGEKIEQVLHFFRDINHQFTPDWPTVHFHALYWHYQKVGAGRPSEAPCFVLSHKKSFSPCFLFLCSSLFFLLLSAEDSAERRSVSRHTVR